MDTPDFPDVDSVAVEPDHCHRCGAAVGVTEFEGREHPWCPECDLVLSRNPVAGVQAVVRDDDADRVLLLDEPVPQHEGVRSLPGGHVRHDEGPREALVRELAEETGLRADPADPEFLTIHHAEFPDVALYLVTYTLERSQVSGEPTPEFEGFEAAFLPVAEVLSSPDRLRESDRRRIETAFDVE
ncbi:NUDIX hydrolase [Halorussus sp. AFM4]|uniref:NUDIX hydrolase n=1 Tax=Halorussus sp. AFM4 TaxID=3421651 RepID=UPI003EB91D85